MYTLATTRKAGRFGEDCADEKDVPVLPPSPPRPVSFGLDQTRLVSQGDSPLDEIPKRTSAQNHSESHQAPNIRASQRNGPDELARELFLMREQQQQLERDLQLMQLHQQQHTHGGLVPDPGPPPRTVHCLSRSNSTISDISFKEREWFDDPSLTSSNPALKRMLSANDWEGVILNATMQNQGSSLESEPRSRASNLSALTSRHSKGTRNTTSELEIDSGYSSPLQPPKRKTTIVVSPREFTVWNPNPTIGIDDVRERQQTEQEELLVPKPSSTDNNSCTERSGIQRSPYCSIEETNQTFQQLHPEVAAAVQREMNVAAHQQEDPEPSFPMEELRIEGLTEDEMIRLAIETSKREEEERQQFFSACFVQDDIVVDPIQAYSLETMMEQPRPERTFPYNTPKAKGMKKVRKILGLGGRGRN